MPTALHNFVAHATNNSSKARMFSIALTVAAAALAFLPAPDYFSGACKAAAIFSCVRAVFWVGVVFTCDQVEEAT